MTTDDRSLHHLTVDECWELLAQYHVGRVAVNVPGGAPLVVPVNYVLDGRVVVFRSDAGTKVDALRLGPVSFELDQINPGSRTGWSVLVSGVAYEAMPDETARLHLEPWSDGEKRLWIRLLPRTVTGRKIILPAYVPHTQGYM
jgi:nitroimidazol reductase NimA-like FMN-containing flavoprotein (pyridoxamine 5'-phosphate oxidase superfamily)